jgi:hypothetical protein
MGGRVEIKMKSKSRWARRASTSLRGNSPIDFVAPSKAAAHDGPKHEMGRSQGVCLPRATAITAQMRMSTRAFPWKLSPSCFYLPFTYSEHRILLTGNGLLQMRTCVKVVERETNAAPYGRSFLWM